ncbi:sugar-binding domain-containing protein [Paenibacillus agricola]|uniref:sugar-binding domain-containing protein n=1 Tax=Paenibacillus agricola TaxID=2716264 RepID=UPI001A9DD041|nr:sugar-binding domain-containing protein [Paenibacillus agricola]
MVNYYGVAWYDRTFQVQDRDRKKRQFLHFDAVDYMTRVWVNGSYVGEREGGFTPFEFDITEYLSDQDQQTVTVREYDPQDNSDIPIGKHGSWYTRVSGIWQDVFIEERPAVFVEHAWITPDIDKCSISVKYRINSNTHAILGKGKLSYSVKHHLGEATVYEAWFFLMCAQHGRYL